MVPLEFPGFILYVVNFQTSFGNIGEKFIAVPTWPPPTYKQTGTDTFFFYQGQFAPHLHHNLATVLLSTTLSE